MRLQFNKVALALAAAGVISGLAGCGGGSGGTNSSGFVNPPVQPSSLKGVTLVFVDANDPTKLITDTVSFKLTGQTSGMLTNLTGAGSQGAVLASGVTQSTNSGKFELLADFSAGGDFTVTPDSNTWISYPPTVKSDGTVAIKLLKKSSNDPSTYLTASATSTWTAEIPANSGLGAAKISITPDQSLGNLSISVVKFADSKVAELNALNQGTFLLSNQAPMARFVVTDSTGKVIKDFPQGVTLQIQLADQSLSEGDYSGLIRSYDEGSGQWINQNVVNGQSAPFDVSDRNRISNASIVNVGGVKVLQFTAYHLSIWSLAYTGAGYCNASSLTLTGRPAGNSDGISFQMIGTGANSSFNKTRTGVTDNTLALYFVPNFPVNVIATKTGTNPPQEVGRLENVSFCVPATPPNTTPVAQPQTMALTGFVPTTPATLRVNVIEACSEDINVTRPGPTTVQFTPAGSTLPAGGWTGDDGSIDITKVFNPYNLEVDLNLNTGGTLKIWNRFTSLWDTVPQANASFTVDQAIKTVNWRITTTCNVPTGTTGSTGQF